MKQYFIMGASDDLVEVEGDLSEEFSADVPISINDWFYITGNYNDNGDWKFKITDEVRVPPTWKLRKFGYNDEMVVLEIPDEDGVRFKAVIGKDK